MTWLIHFGLLTTYGILGSILVFVGVDLLFTLLGGLFLSDHNLLMDLTDKIIYFASFLIDGSKDDFFIYITIASMIFAIFVMSGVEFHADLDDDFDSVDSTNDWYTDTQVHEHYGYKL